MLSEREKAALDAILRNIDLAEDFLGNTSEHRFGEDPYQLYAVTRALEIISEASRRLPPELKEPYPAIRWREIADAGNVYRHGYDLVAPKRLWQTVKDHLPLLRHALQQEL